MRQGNQRELTVQYSARNISGKCVLPGSTSRSMTPPMCRSPRTRRIFSTWRSVMNTRIFHVLSPTWIILPWHLIRVFSGGNYSRGYHHFFFVDCNLLRFVVLRWSNFEMLIRQSLPQLLLLLSSIGRYASDKFLFTFKALHPLPLSLSNSTPSASSLLRFDIYVYEYFSEVDVRARFAYITYCFKVTTPIRSHKKTLFWAQTLTNTGYTAPEESNPILCDKLTLNYHNFYEFVAFRRRLNA